MSTTTTRTVTDPVLAEINRRYEPGEWLLWEEFANGDVRVWKTNGHRVRHVSCGYEPLEGTIRAALARALEQINAAAEQQAA